MDAPWGVVCRRAYIPGSRAANNGPAVGRPRPETHPQGHEADGRVLSSSFGSVVVATLDDDAPALRYPVYEAVLLGDPA